MSSNGLSDLPILFDFADSGAGAVSTGEIKVGTDADHARRSAVPVQAPRSARARLRRCGRRPRPGRLRRHRRAGRGDRHPRFLGYVADQLLISGAGAAGGYANRIDESGIVKADCRGRSASYADPDGGGNLDLLTTCEGQVPRLWAQTLPGGFVQVPPPPVIGSTYRWASLDRGPPALLVSTRTGPRGLAFARRRSPGAVPRPSARVRRPARSRSATTTTPGPSTCWSPAGDTLPCSPTSTVACARSAPGSGCRGRPRRVRSSTTTTTAGSISASPPRVCTAGIGTGRGTSTPGRFVSRGPATRSSSGWTTTTTAAATR